MANYDIGIDGLNAVQQALDIIGNNIANAATDGYHRQRINLTPAYFSQSGSTLLGGGVDVESVTRMIDNLLEQEILRQRSSLGQVLQEFATLRTIESTFGELLTEDGGLSAAIDGFFNALANLSGDHGEIGAIEREAVLFAAENMAARFRTLGEFLTTLETQIRYEAENTIEQINTLINQIAELNDKIRSIELTGTKANNLLDQRDQCITELSELIGLETQSREYGVVDVNAGGIPVVLGSTATELEVGLQNDGSLGVGMAGSSSYNTDIQGGKLGGLLALKNELVSEIHDDLDSLATAIIQQVNQYHVGGVGAEGSFTELTGWSMADEDLADFANPSVSDGSIFIRVINTSTGAITREEITVDADNDTLSDIATAIDAITGLGASVINSRLRITADTNYEFDFLPAVLPDPTASTLTGGTPPTISVGGIYTGTDNDTFKVTVSGAGSVGNGTLQLEVKDNGGAGDVIATLNIGSGYAAGDWLEVGNGIRISLTTGDFGVGDNFEVDAFADTDTSEVLAATGMNTFFSGSNATTMAVCSDIAATPGRIAMALGADMTDNANALRMAALAHQAISSLDAMAPGEFYRRLVTNVGQQLSIKRMRQDNIEVMVRNLADQQDEISGVDINEEAAQLLVFEQMFQAMAKYLSTIQSTLSSIMEII